MGGTAIGAAAGVIAIPGARCPPPSSRQRGAEAGCMPRGAFCPAAARTFSEPSRRKPSLMRQGRSRHAVARQIRTRCRQRRSGGAPRSAPGSARVQSRPAGARIGPVRRQPADGSAWNLLLQAAPLDVSASMPGARSGGGDAAALALDAAMRRMRADAQRNDPGAMANRAGRWAGSDELLGEALWRQRSMRCGARGECDLMRRARFLLPCPGRA